MKQSIHFVCERLPDGQSRHLKHIEGTNKFASGYWDISEDKAKLLVGGWIYLHTTKTERSYRGGLIHAYEIEIREEYSRSKRVKLIFQPKPEAIGQSWRGQDHGMARNSGPVEAFLPHEQN
jgi:hypothetical protein